MKFIKSLIIIAAISSVINASNESLEECGLIAYVLLIDDQLDLEYFEICADEQAERLNEKSSQEHAKV